MCIVKKIMGTRKVGMSKNPVKGMAEDSDDILKNLGMKTKRD